MHRDLRLGLLFLGALTIGCSAPKEPDDATEEDQLFGNYSTPDKNNLWMRGVDLSSLAVGEERVLPDEQTMFERFALDVGEIQAGFEKKFGDKQRGFHAKPHACVLGEITVRPPASLPSARVGLFAKEATYPTWVRYSSGVGFVQKDRHTDVRGLAFKVMKVPGKKLLAGAEEAGTQDFLMTNGATTPAPDTRQFVAFGKAMADGTMKSDGSFVGGIEAMLHTGGYLLRPENARVRSFLANKALPRRLARGSMLAEQFWTGGAIALGVSEPGPGETRVTSRALGAAKLTAIPGVLQGDGRCASQTKLPNDFDADYFRTDIKARMKAGKTCIDVRMQIQRDPTKQLLEDTSVEWRESDTAFVSVATIIVPQTDLEGDAAARAREGLCNELGFTPWHSLVEHRPLGNIMRSRKIVYEQSRDFRAGRAEPTGDERF